MAAIVARVAFGEAAVAVTVAGLAVSVAGVAGIQHSIGVAVIVASVSLTFAGVAVGLANCFSPGQLAFLSLLVGRRLYSWI